MFLGHQIMGPLGNFRDLQMNHIIAAKLWNGKIIHYGWGPKTSSWGREALNIFIHNIGIQDTA